MARPVKSIIRQKMIDILYHKNNLTGYDIFKIYIAVFGKVTSRSIYYHLKKGLSIDEFKINNIVEEEGDFSWGTKTNKIYYDLGSNAVPNPNKEIIKYLNSISD